MNSPYNVLGGYGSNYNCGKSTGIQNMPLQVSCVEPYVVSALLT